MNKLHKKHERIVSNANQSRLACNNTYTQQGMGRIVITLDAPPEEPKPEIIGYRRFVRIFKQTFPGTSLESCRFRSAWHRYCAKHGLNERKPVEKPKKPVEYYGMRGTGSLYIKPNADEVRAKNKLAEMGIEYTPKVTASPCRIKRNKHRACR